MFNIVKTVFVFIATLLLQGWLLVKSRKLIRLLIAWIRKMLRG